LDLQNILGAYFLGCLVGGGVGLAVKDDLGKAVAVAQVDENKRALVAPPVNPSA
jgi:hypothetical protein